MATCPRRRQVERVGLLALRQEELAGVECDPAGTAGHELDSALGLTGEKSRSRQVPPASDSVMATGVPPAAGAVGRPDGGGLLGEVDADRAPGDAPATTDAPRLAELVPPGRQLVGEPLPVAGLGGRPHRAAVDVRVVEVEAG